VDFTESIDQIQLREAVRDVASQFGHAYYADKVRRGEKTDELWHALAELGFLGVHLPEKYGGGGAGIAELAIVCEEVAALGCPLLLLLVSAAICAELIARFGADEQKRRWLPGLANGQKMAFAITEPDAGSNTHRLSTVATKQGEEQILVVTRTSVDASTGQGRLTLLIVDRDSPGLTRTLIPVEIASPEKQFTLFFDDVQVPADRRLGDEDDGLRVVFFGLNPELITGAALSSGIGRYALSKASDYARVRQVWGVPIGSHQGVAHPLATAKVELELARLMTAKAAWSHDSDADRKVAGEAANMAKFAAADAALHCLDAAIQTHGGNGMASEYGLADLWGLARLLRIAPVSREMVLNFVAQHSLGMPRSYG
jgi:alkylation response protein AidB-like acyl-CoA dehydrogenase